MYTLYKIRLSQLTWTSLFTGIAVRSLQTNNWRWDVGWGALKGMRTGKSGGSLGDLLILLFDNPWLNLGVCWRLGKQWGWFLVFGFEIWLKLLFPQVGALDFVLFSKGPTPPLEKQGDVSKAYCAGLYIQGTWIYNTVGIFNLPLMMAKGAVWLLITGLFGFIIRQKNWTTWLFPVTSQISLVMTAWKSRIVMHGQPQS